MKHQDHQRGPDQRTYQQVCGPESRRQELQHHGGGNADLQHGERHDHDRPSAWRSAGWLASDRRLSRTARRQDSGQKYEGERAVGPGQERQVGSRGGSRAVAKGKAQTEEPGVEVGHLRPEQDHHEAQGGGRQYLAVG